MNYFFQYMIKALKLQKLIFHIKQILYCDTTWPNLLVAAVISFIYNKNKFKIYEYCMSYCFDTQLYTYIALYVNCHLYPEHILYHRR